MCCKNQPLLGVQLDDQLFIDGLRNLFADGHRSQLADVLSAIPLEPGALRGSGSKAVLDNLEALGTLADTYDVTRADLCGRHVANLTVEGDVAVRYQLTCSSTRRSDTEAINEVVDAGFKQEDEVLAGAALHPVCLCIEVAELTLEKAVGVLHLLLLSQLNAVLRSLLALLGETVLSRRIVLLFEILVGAVNRFPEFAGYFGCGPCISCHNPNTFKLDEKLDAATALRTATVVRNRGHVDDLGDLDTCAIEGADGRFTA